MKQWAALAALMLLAITLRLGADLYLDAARSLSNENRQIAAHLASGQGYSFREFQHLGPTSVRAPVYPALLAVLHQVSEADAYWTGFGALGINLTIAGAIVPLSFLLALRLTSRPRVAWAFAVLMAIWPTQIYAATFVQGLTLAIMLSLGAILLLLRARVSPEHRQTAFAVAGGFLAALAMLTEAMLTWPLLLSALFLLFGRPRLLLAAALPAMVLIGPWLYRNALVHNQLTGITNTFSRDLFNGNGPDATGSLHLETANFAGRPVTRVEQLSPQETDALRRQPESIRNAWFRQRTIAWIAEHPGAYLKLCAVRIAKTLWLDWHHPQSWRGPNVIARSIALVGFMLALALRRNVTLPLLWCAGVVLGSTFTLAEARTSTFIDVGQLLALAMLADRRLKT
ncbi:MAG TPA: hypothetical protein VGB55_08235 [Tepidisphaeraceae bacterium]|jgi:hypothetical protein